MVEDTCGTRSEASLQHTEPSRLAWVRSVLERPPVALALLALLSAWLGASLPIFSQEAYYWTYAQHPDLSYFDHPPMVAWLILLGTKVLGDGTLGVRLGTWLCGLAATWLGILLLRDFGIDRRGQATWIVLAMVSPIVMMTHFFANPDAPLVAAWTLTIWAIWRARSGLLRWWLLAGLGTGLGLLSKYSAAFLGLGGLVLMVADAPMRRQLRRPGPWLAVLVAVAVFLPVVIWNMENHYESFRFQTTERLGKGAFRPALFAEFVGSQVGLLHPLLAIALAPALGFLLRRARVDARALHLLAFGVPMVAYLLFQSLFIQVKLNWVAPSYVALLLGIAWWWSESGAVAILQRPAWRRALPLLGLTLLVIPIAPAVRLLPPGRGTSWTGWDEIAACAEKWEEQLDGADGIEGNVFFFAADYRDAAQLGRNLQLMWVMDPKHHGDPARPGEPVLAQNVLGQRALQFDHWASPAALVGQDAVFVLPRPKGREEMVRKAEERFASVELVERLQVECMGVDLIDVNLYVCKGYRGPEVER